MKHFAANILMGRLTEPAPARDFFADPAFARFASDLPMQGGYRATVIVPLDPPVTYCKARIWADGQDKPVADISFCILKPRTEAEWEDLLAFEFEGEDCMTDAWALFGDQLGELLGNFSTTAYITSVYFRASANLSDQEQARLVKTFTDALHEKFDVSLTFMELDSREEAAHHAAFGAYHYGAFIEAIIHTSLEPAALHKRGVHGRKLAKSAGYKPEAA